MPAGTSLYIAWAGFQRRQVSMAPYCGFTLVFLPVQRPVNRFRKGWRYLRNAWRTLSILRKERPDVVWMQLPQVPLLWVTLLYRFAVRGKPILVADCHNAMFRTPWSKVPLGVGLLSKCDIVVVHTDEMKDTAMKQMVPADRLMVIGDPPAKFLSRPVSEPLLLVQRPWIIFPASFSEDEPIGAVIEAARHVPNISILITGDYVSLDKLRLHALAPSNVRFLGFLTRDDLETMIMACDAVIAFTKLDGLQMSVCGEAIGCDKPMLISNTPTLRRLFPKGGVFVDSSDPTAIAAGMQKLFTEHDWLSEQVAKLHKQLDDDWENLYAPRIADRIASAPGAPNVHGER